MTNKTDLPLHEVVLKILYLENTEKAVAMTAEDVLWRIDNPEYTERYIREVLDWLVLNKKVTLYLGKYTIDRVEFLRQKELEKETNLLLDNGTKPKKSKTFYVNKPNKTKTPVYLIYTLLIAIIYLSYYTYSEYKNKHNITSFQSLNKDNTESAFTPVSPVKPMYVSIKKENINNDFEKSINLSFYRQNSTNERLIKEINLVNFKLDSIITTHQKILNNLKQELNDSKNRSNNFIRNAIFFNCGIIILILILLIHTIKNKS